MVRAGVAEHPDRGRVELSLLRLLRHGEVMPKQARFAEKSSHRDVWRFVAFIRFPTTFSPTTIGTRG
jgi:hypothetical protein